MQWRSLLLVRQEHQHRLKTAAVVDTPELFQEITEATVVLAALASTIAADVASARRKQLVCGLATAPKAVLTPVPNAKAYSVVAVFEDGTAAVVAEAAVAVLEDADSIKAALVTHLADVAVAAASAATVALAVDAAVAVVLNQSLPAFVKIMARQSAVASVVHVAVVVSADAFVAAVVLKDASSTKCWLVTQPTHTSDSPQQTLTALAAT